MAQSNMAFTIEPYRRGGKFSDWVERLTYFFSMNKVEKENYKAYFITMSGPTVFTELKLLFPNTELTQVSYDEMIRKLKSRLDKTETDFIQRVKFNNRVQLPNESVEDFILAVKLLAEFCGFENFKNSAIRDRIVAGVRDKSLQQRLLNEDNPTLETVEKVVATWEIATNNAVSLNTDTEISQVGALYTPGHQGRRTSYDKLALTYQAARNLNRGSVKDRLGFRSTPRGTGRIDSSSRGGLLRTPRNNKSKYANMICDFCNMRGHIKRKCYALKNLLNHRVHSIDEDDPKEGPSTRPSVDENLNELMGRMTTRDSDDESDGYNSDSNWKRGNYRTSRTTEDDQ